jgi:hypothetical protein
MTSLATVTVRNAFATETGTYRAQVDTDGTVRDWDSVAGHYTRCHSLTPAQITSAQRRSGWAAIARARRAVDAAEAQVASLRGWATPRQADRYAAAQRRLSAAVARWERVQPTV